jgi:hypothetical protein
MPFKYDEDRAKAGLLRHLNRGLERLVPLARAGDAEGLLDVLQSLSDEECAAIAWLLANTLREPKPGRPRGSNPDVVPRAERWVANQIRTRKHAWRKKHERVRVPGDVSNRWMKELIGSAERRYPRTRGKIDVDNIKTLLKKTVN